MIKVQNKNPIMIKFNNFTIKKIKYNGATLYSKS